MEARINREGKHLSVKISDRLDAQTAPELDDTLFPQLEGIESLSIDLSELVYISSAGLRVLLRCQKIMNEQGEMKVSGVDGQVREIFEASGFDQILNVE